MIVRSLLVFLLLTALVACSSSSKSKDSEETPDASSDPADPSSPGGDDSADPSQSVAPGGDPGDSLAKYLAENDLLGGSTTHGALAGQLVVEASIPLALPASGIPSNALPASALPASALPASALPSSALPASALPASALPASALPASALPASYLLLSPTEPQVGEMKTLYAGDALKKVAAGVTVRLLDALGFERASTVSDVQGIYAFNQIEAGEYTVEALAKDTAGKNFAIKEESIVIVAGNIVDLSQLSLAETGALVGAVGVADQTVTDLTGIDVYVPGTSFTAKTDKNGRFIILYLIAGTYELRYEWAGFAPATVTGLTVESARSTLVETQTLALAYEFGALTGKVTLFDSPAHAEILVRISGKTTRDTDFVLEFHPAADGSFRFDRVPAGTFTVSYSLDGYLPAEELNLSLLPHGSLKLEDKVLQPAAATAGGDPLFVPLSVGYGTKNVSVSWLDLDGDTWPDLLIGDVPGQSTLVHYDPVTPDFVEVTDRQGILSCASDAPLGATRYSAGDFNGDGSVDLLYYPCSASVSGEEVTSINILVGVSGAAYSEPSDPQVSGAFANHDLFLHAGHLVLADLNPNDETNPNLLDLFFSSGGSVHLPGDTGNDLIRNYSTTLGGIGLRTPDNFFQTQMPQANQATFIDYDLDNRPDLFLCVEGEEEASALFHSDGNDAWSDALQGGMLQDGDIFGCTAAGWGDADNDGRPDLFVGSSSSLFGLYLTHEVGTTLRLVPLADTDRVQPETLATYPQRAACILFLDMDNDGDQDILEVRGARWDVLHKNNGNGTFTTVVTGLGLPDNSQGTVCAASDFDRDGDLDVYVGTSDQGGAPYRNDAQTLYPDNRWLRVRAQTDSGGDATDGPEDDRPAIGARVDIDLDGDGNFVFTANAAPGTAGSAQTRQLGFGEVFQSEPIAHFGLGLVDQVDVRVTFADGSVVICSDVPANITLDVLDASSLSAEEMYAPSGTAHCRKLP
ncbi:MAG: hypothetical protein A2284_12630 [Deltaproteobacteria bacterium RIFOXYA12_FULL_61_11]|nr:MAG: hypothetical protein A2284_12630 [Deltaproteobacteria bacterium RIFOXYA12_FULL_61_11]